MATETSRETDERQRSDSKFQCFVKATNQFNCENERRLRKTISPVFFSSFISKSNHYENNNGIKSKRTDGV